MRRRRLICGAVTTVIAAAAMTGCSGGYRQSTDVVIPVATTSELPGPTQAPETFRSAGCDSATGGGGKNVAMLLRDVRVGKQDDFDRVTFEFGADSKSTVPLDQLVVPKYNVAPASSVAAGPGGDSVKVTGAALIAVNFDGASAHEQSKPIRSYPGPNDITPPGFPILAEAKQGEDFEGHVTWALGLNKSVCPDVSTLTNPPRLVVDLPH